MGGGKAAAQPHLKNPEKTFKKYHLSPFTPQAAPTDP
jgi:hypothetical protein